MRTMSRISKRRRVVLPLLAIGLFSGGVERGVAADGTAGHVAEHVTLTNGFDLICDHREQTGDRVKLYTEADNSNFVEVGVADVASVETIEVPMPPWTLGMARAST